MLDELFNDSTETLYDEYIERPNLTERKNLFEYIVPPPTLKVGSEQKAISVVKEFSEKKKRTISVL